MHYFADLQSVTGFVAMNGFCCYDNIAPNAKCQRVLVLSLCLIIFASFSVSLVGG